MTWDPIRDWADLVMFSLAFGVATWTFFDTEGVSRFVFRMSRWAPWISASEPTLSRGLVAFLKFDAALVAVGTAVVVLRHFLTKTG